MIHTVKQICFNLGHIWLHSKSSSAMIIHCSGPYVITDTPKTVDSAQRRVDWVSTIKYNNISISPTLDWVAQVSSNLFLPDSSLSQPWAEQVAVCVGSLSESFLLVNYINSCTSLHVMSLCSLVNRCCLSCYNITEY